MILEEEADSKNEAGPSTTTSNGPPPTAAATAAALQGLQSAQSSASTEALQNLQTLLASPDAAATIDLLTSLLQSLRTTVVPSPDPPPAHHWTSAPPTYSEINEGRTVGSPVRMLQQELHQHHHQQRQQQQRRQQTPSPAPLYPSTPAQQQQSSSISNYTLPSPPSTPPPLVMDSPPSPHLTPPPQIAQPRTPSPPSPTDSTIDIDSDDSGRTERPSPTFFSLGLQSRLLTPFLSNAIHTPTPLQRKLLRALLSSSSRDIACVSSSSGGKTTALLLGILHLINPSARVTQALIVTSGKDETDTLWRLLTVMAPPGVEFHGVDSVDWREDQQKCRAGTKIIIGSAERIAFFIHRKALSLDHLKVFAVKEPSSSSSLSTSPSNSPSPSPSPSPSTILRRGSPAPPSPSPHTSPLAESTHRLIPYLPTSSRRIYLSSEPPRASPPLRQPALLLTGPTPARTLKGLKHVFMLLPLEARLSKVIDMFNQFCANPTVVLCNSRTTCEALGRRLEQRRMGTSLLSAPTSPSGTAGLLEPDRNGRSPPLITTLFSGHLLDKVHLVVNYEFDADEYTQRCALLSTQTLHDRERAVVFSFVSIQDVGRVRGLAKEMDFYEMHPESTDFSSGTTRLYGRSDSELQPLFNELMSTVSRA